MSANQSPLRAMPDGSIRVEQTEMEVLGKKITLPMGRIPGLELGTLYFVWERGGAYVATKDTADLSHDINYMFVGSIRTVSEPILQFFAYAHLAPSLQEASRPFGELAERIVATLPRNPERTVALRKLLEAKDAAVRALVFKEEGA